MSDICVQRRIIIEIKLRWIFLWNYYYTIKAHLKYVITWGYGGVPCNSKQEILLLMRIEIIKRKFQTVKNIEGELKSIIYDND